MMLLKIVNAKILLNYDSTEKNTLTNLPGYVMLGKRPHQSFPPAARSCAKTDQIKSHLGQSVALAWAETDETATKWIYLAKKEYGSGTGACILHANCLQVLYKLTMNPASLQGPGNSIGTLSFNGLGPADSATVLLSCDHPSLVIMPSSMTVTGLNRTFTAQIGSVMTTTTIRFTAEYDRSPTDKDIVTLDVTVTP